MWQNENLQEENLINEYKTVIKQAKKQSDSILYLYIQLFFTAVILVVSFMLKNGSSDIFLYAKDNYNQFFETDTYMESTFSFNSFIQNMETELQTRFNRLITVFNSKGSAAETVFPSNVSTERYYLKYKGVTPAEGYVSSPYGIRTNPFNKNEKEFHTGMDIAAPKGTFIRAAFDGTVTDADKSSIAGNYIKIESDDGISTMYAHNQFLLVKAGDKVIAGQVIATMGATGLATGPHLHFEFLVDGIRYNPIYALDI